MGECNSGEKKYRHAERFGAHSSTGPMLGATVHYTLTCDKKSWSARKHTYRNPLCHSCEGPRTVAESKGRHLHLPRILALARRLKAAPGVTLVLGTPPP